nr:pneumococcal serine-rich repeat protein isoform X11 [Bactrocera oleae]
MEVATTNNHHHNHHHHQQHQHLGHQLHHPAHRLPMAKAQQQQQQKQSNNCLTVSSALAATSDNATRTGNSGGSPRSPFQREVREWQRIDPDTGALLSGRLEADRWINGPLNSYGKISDSQNISQPNGTQHTQRKQLEVLQKRTANGAVQVIRAQTIQTSSSRSWSSSNSNSASTSASASASASPICMQTNVVGGRSILHNHNNNSSSNHNNNINSSSKHFHSTLQQHLAEANTHWLQLSPPTIATTVDISEVSTDDSLDKAAATIAETQYIVDDGEIDADDDGNGDSVGCGFDADVNASAVPCNYSISRSGSAGSGGGSSSKGHALSSSAASSSSTLHSQSSGLLVPDTAPSLKLSNLMKSSSGGSSSSNNSTKLNTHKSAVGKVSLHAIVGSGGGASVGDNNNTKSSSRVNNELAESPKSTATTKSSNQALSGTKTWQSPPKHQQQRSNARHLEQATLYGKNSNSSKTRVGVADCDDCYAVVADADESQLRYHQHHLQPQQLRKQQQQSGSLSETTPPTRRRDLESFRLYGDSTAASTFGASAMAGAATADNNAKADDLRLSTRQLRRQQQPFGQLSSSVLLQRSHSISTDDLSNEWETNEAVAESNEWRRVSKLRRSFQSSSTANNSVKNSNDPTTTSIQRPYDLPASTVSVSRIRAELESGRRLTTAMRNNHVDLAALESILHGPEKITDASKRNTLLTAESLKEIRGRLKKLSDESLYKDDFIAYQQPPAADEHIEVQQSVRRKLSIPRLRPLTPEESLEISTPTHHTSAFKVVGVPQKPTDNNETLAQRSTHLNQKHTSNSLESRQKVRDTNSTEWHSRRKSYGFEKMSPPDSKTMYRMDASTDSGLGRSGELGNWSPTEAAAPTAARATVIHFGEPAKTVTSAQYRAGKSPVRRTPDEDLLKRHSIAVDESQYVRDNLRKTSQVHLNGFYEPAEPTAKTTLQLSRFEHNAESNQGINAGSTLFQRSQNAQKRVEFCKTEVHFAAESGRVNIVETDGKPPPTNNFRRRRRTTSGPLQSLTKTGSTVATTTTAVSTATAATIASNVTHFGDDHQQRHRTIATSVVAYKATLTEPPTVVNDAQVMPATTNVTVSVQKLCEAQHAESSRGSYASTTSGVDTTDNENDEIAAIRGILKNKPVKPKPYHLGENIDSADALWGIQLKPVAGGGSSAVGVSEKEDSPTAVLNKTVAERVRIVEKRHEHNAPNGYSTKINLSLDEPAAARDWPSADLPKSNIMSIELHSPQTSLEKRDSFKRNQTPPVAKPRTVTSAGSANENPQIHVATTVKQTADRFTAAEQQRESLKIVKEARGARKLREHELSYFGVPHAHKHDDNETKPKLLPNSNLNTISLSKRSLPSRQRLTVIGNDDTKSMRRHEANNTDTTTTTTTVSGITQTQTKAQTATKWQLLNDKPDLLRHSPIAVEPQLTRRTADVQQRERNCTSVECNKRMSSKELRIEDELNDVDADDDPNEHYYENITNEITPVFKVKSPQPYDRKMDVERDAYILNEMNENADLTMKALSDEAAHKDRRRRRSSLHRRDSKPLETIEEKMITQKPNDSCIAVKMSRGTLASEAKRHARNDKNTRVRTSSQSSVESCPRARSRSLSSEREYENIRTPKTTRTPATAATKTQSKTAGKQQHRSSSRESQRSARLPYSSGDEVNPREEQRVRLKSKRSSNVTSGTTGRGSAERRSSSSNKKDTDKHGHHTTTASSRDIEQRRCAASSTTHASQREERAECVTVPQQQRITSSERSSSGKRREEHATSNTANSGGSSGRHSSSRTATEKSRSSANAGVRLLRSLRVGRTDDAKAASTEHRGSGHRSTSEREREKAHEIEREKELQSKSRELLVLGILIMGATQPQTLHKTLRHSKSSQIINGRHTGQHDGHRKHNDQKRVHTRPPQNERTSTTTHKKRSEHSAKERK